MVEIIPRWKFQKGWDWNFCYLVLDIEFSKSTGSLGRDVLAKNDLGVFATQKTFLFYCNVHTIKNIRNNLLSRDKYTGEVGGGRVTGRGSKIFENW